MKQKSDYQVRYASVGDRAFAIIVDTFLLGLISGLIFGAMGDIGWGISFVMTLVYNWFFWTRWDGQTPGKRLMGIRVAKVDGSAISDVDALIRATGYYVSGMVMGIGYLWALFDKEKRSWHDIFAGTIVINDAA